VGGRCERKRRDITAEMSVLFGSAVFPDGSDRLPLSIDPAETHAML